MKQAKPQPQTPATTVKVVNKPVLAKDQGKDQVKAFKEGFGCKTING